MNGNIFAMDPESNQIIMRILENITIVPSEPKPHVEHVIMGGKIYKNGIECARGMDASVLKHKDNPAARPNHEETFMKAKTKKPRAATARTATTQTPQATVEAALAQAQAAVRQAQKVTNFEVIRAVVTRKPQ